MQAARRGLRGGALRAGRQLSDSLPVARELLDFEQDGDAVETVVQGERRGHVVMEARDVARVVESSGPQVRG